MKLAFRHPLKAAVIRLSKKGKFDRMSDAAFLKLIFWARLGKRLDLKDPKTFNEKIQWLKLYDRNPIYSTMVDKYKAKEYVASILGSEYVIPSYGVWDHFDDIDFDSLPDSFVLKTTHDSGGVVICRDKKNFDREAAKAKLEARLKYDYYLHTREWPYKNVKAQIIAEKFMEDTADDALTDYKFFCFDGEPKIMYIAKDTGKAPRTDYFDMDFQHLPIKVRDPNAEITPEKPECFDKMREIARTLSQGIPHVRVDFYYINGQIYFGEFTFSHCSGLVEVRPAEWNERMGSWIKLPRAGTTEDNKMN